MSSFECPSTPFFVIESGRNECETFGAVAVLAGALNRWAVRVRMTALTVWVVVVCGHVFEYLVDVTADAGNVAMFAGEFKVGFFIVVELNPRKSRRGVAKAAFFINLTLIVWVAMTVAALGGGELFKFAIEVALVAVENEMFAGEWEGGALMAGEIECTLGEV